MYIYLSKKIAVRSNTKITCLSWNKSDGYIAVGGEQGLLKVVKLESGSLAAPSNLTLNQPLEKHTEDLKVVTWNPIHKKLTTSDESGVIIVWILYKGNWHEEMVNNRKKSTVVDMAWSNDGARICIAYADGAVIVGSVGGNRIWGKDLRDTALAKVQWSPDGKLLLFGLQTGEVNLYDNMGNFIMPIETNYNYMEDQFDNSIVSLCWHGGDSKTTINYSNNSAATILIAHESGRIQLLSNTEDPNGRIIDTKVMIASCCWDNTGSLFAVVGKDLDNNYNVAQVFSPFGELLRSLRLPGENVTCCSWENGSLRLALAIDSAIYFANIRPDYKWSHFKNIVVYASKRIQQEGGVCMTFWDTNSNQCRTRNIPFLLALASGGHHCVIATINTCGQNTLLLCNALGNIIDTKSVDFEVKFITMNSTYVVAASLYTFYIWQYRTAKTKLLKTRDIECRRFHVEDTSLGAIEISSEHPISSISENPICTITVSDKALVIGRASGALWHFVFPHMGLIKKYQFDVRSDKISINCNSSRLAIIDLSGTLTVVDMSLHSNVDGNDNNRLERKDVWSMCWAADNPQLLAIMEKTRMYVFKGDSPEEPISSAGYICSFKDLEIKAIFLDDIMEKSEKPSTDQVFKLEVKSLRDTRQLLEKVGIKEAQLFIEDNPHPRLWNLLGEAALKQLNYEVAMQAFVKAKDFSSIQLIKSLDDYSNDFVKKAYIAAHFKQFDEAEKFFTEADRRDMALEMRVRIGDWFRAIQMVKNGVYASDELITMAYHGTGDYFAQKTDWTAALEYYELTKNKMKLVRAYAHLEDYGKLEKLMQQLKEGDPLLKLIGQAFATGGFPLYAIDAFLKLGDVNAAASVSVTNQLWEQAVKIAYKYNLPQVSQAFVDYTNLLLKENRYKRAVQVNIEANYLFTAGRILGKFATKLLEKTYIKIEAIKRLYLYSAYYIERYKSMPLKYEKVSDWRDNFWFDNPWRGAEAMTLLSLAHRQIYSNQAKEAICTAFRLEEYTDFLSEGIVYSLLGIAAGMCGMFAFCSDAFVKISISKELSDAEKEECNANALEIFQQRAADDMRHNIKINVPCLYCQTPICMWLTECPHCEHSFVTCMIGGKPSITLNCDMWKCATCSNYASANLIVKRKTCPVCYNVAAP